MFAAYQRHGAAKRLAICGWQTASPFGCLNTLLHCGDCVEVLADLCVGSFGQKRNDNDEDAGGDECGQQLVDRKRAADGSYCILPDEDHSSAGEHAGDRAPLVAALPVKREQNDGAEGCAEACPCEGYDAEYGACGIKCEQHTADSHAQNSDAGNDHALFVVKLNAEHAADDVLRDSACRCKQLNVGSGHGGGKDACKDKACEDSEECAVLGQDCRDGNDDRLGGGSISEHGDDVLFCHGVAYNADHDCDRQGNNDPDGSNTAAELELILVLDGHEVKNNVGHAEVAERPCEGGYYLESAELAGLGGLNAGGCGHAEVAGDGLGVCNDIFPAADGVDAEDEDDRQSKDHYKALHKARYRRCLEAAACGVCYDYGSAYYHGGNVVISEQSSEKLAAGREAGSCVGNVENDDGYGAYKLDELGVIVEAAGYVLGQSQRSQTN